MVSKTCQALPNGGCFARCGATLPCGHACPLRCHPLLGNVHDKVKCELTVSTYCAHEHLINVRCGADRATARCDVCEELKQLELAAQTEREKLLKQEAQQLAEIAKKRKKAQLEAGEVQRKIDAEERKTAAALGAAQKEIELEKLERAHELQKTNAPSEEAAAAAAAMEAAEAEMSRMEVEAAAKRAAQGVETARVLEALKRRRELSSRELSKLELATERTLQQSVNTREAARQKVGMKRGEVAAAASATRVGAEAREGLRRALHDAVG